MPHVSKSIYRPGFAGGWWDYCIKSLKDAGLPKGLGAAAYKNAFQAAVVGLVKPFLTVETSLMTESEWDNDN